MKKLKNTTLLRNDGTLRSGLQHNALASLVHFVVCTKWIRDVSALGWRSTPCFRPFCGSLNYPVFFSKNFLLLVIIIISIFIFVKNFIPQQLIHECRYCSINNTNELHLLVSMCFWVKKGIDGRTNQFEKQQYTGSN